MECFYFYAFTNPTLTGISSHVLPSSVRPALFFRLHSAAGTDVHAAPLLEEKWDFASQALIPNIWDPFLRDWSCVWTNGEVD